MGSVQARGVPVARPRRLRYKLMLGLGLVVGSIGLLLGGTLYGIQAYSTTVRTTERKMVELEIASRIVDTLNPEAQNRGGLDTADYAKWIQNAVDILKEFSKVTADTVALGLDPDNGEHVAGLIVQLKEALENLRNAIHLTPGMDRDKTETFPEKIRQPYESARSCAEALRFRLYDDIKTSIRRSNRDIRQSVWLVYFATFWALALIVTLLYYFRVWMFGPIRQLQAGVIRVHSGDFNHPITLGSGDELQELADEFNAMTVRLAAIYADLARQVNERSRQLVRSERMVSVGFLAAGVAHEINNPLASILFCSEALERRLLDVLASMSSTKGATAPSESEVLTRYLKMIQQEALRCKDITQKLLDFSRTGERKREQTDLAGLVRGVLEVARHLPNCRGKEIVFDPKEYIVAPVNAQDLKSVILNLVVNALDSMDEDGRLTITLGVAEGKAQLAFADSGCGMTPDVLQNIFEPFYTRSRTGKGTGLGLFISHQIIDQHGGTIEASSHGPGLGSTFTVRVPLTEVGGVQEGPEPVIVQFPGAKIAA